MAFDPIVTEPFEAAGIKGKHLDSLLKHFEKYLFPSKIVALGSAAQQFATAGIKGGLLVDFLEHLVEDKNIDPKQIIALGHMVECSAAGLATLSVEDRVNILKNAFVIEIPASRKIQIGEKARKKPITVKSVNIPEPMGIDDKAQATATTPSSESPAPSTLENGHILQEASKQFWFAGIRDDYLVTLLADLRIECFSDQIAAAGNIAEENAATLLSFPSYERIEKLKQLIATQSPSYMTQAPETTAIIPDIQKRNIDKKVSP